MRRSDPTSEGIGEGKRPLDDVGHAARYLLLRYCRYEIIVDGRRQKKEVEYGRIVVKIGGELDEFSRLRQTSTIQGRSWPCGPELVKG